MKRTLPCPIDAKALAPLLPDVGEDVFPAGFDTASEKLDRFVGALAAETARTLGLGESVPPLPDLVSRRAWLEDEIPALQWLMDTLELYRYARRGRTGWRIELPPPDTSSAALAAEADPAAAPAYRILALAAQALPQVLAGEVRGEQVLFGPATMGLWFEYFSNDNPHYAPSNALAAAALAARMPASATVLELGGGGGSAALACLSALTRAGRPPSHYVFTELQPAFLRRGIRTVEAALPTGCRLTSARVDINEPLSAELIRDGVDGIVAVNTLHLARDLVGSLARLRSYLLPGGCLVLGELIRPPDGAVHLELPFALLSDYRSLPIDPDVRPRPGFLTDSQWLTALHEAGFPRVSMIPRRLAECLDIYPGFYSGTLVAES